MVARSQVLHRAATIWPTGSVPYSMVTIHQPDGYRQDCSGFASLCWAIPPGRDGGENTASLVTEGWMEEIPAADLQPGDAVGLCGPGTLGAAGHIQIFETWTATGLVIWEQAGGTFGPTRRTIKGITPGYRAYRFRGITEEGDEMLTPQQALVVWNTGWITQRLAENADPIVIPEHPATDAEPWYAPGATLPNALAQALTAIGSGGGGGGPTAQQIATAVVDEEHKRLAD